MVWFIQPSEIADKDGNPTGRWRMTARSDEGGGYIGDTSHDHATAEDAENCDLCDHYVSSVSGFPSKKRSIELEEERDRKEYERLKAKFEPPVT